MRGATNVKKRMGRKNFEMGKSLKEIIFGDKEIETYLKRFNGNQLEIISNPEKYVGIASRKTKKICDYWEDMIKDLEI